MQVQAREVRYADVVRIPGLGEHEVSAVTAEPGLVTLCVSRGDPACEESFSFKPDTRLEIKRPGSLFGEPEPAPAATRDAFGEAIVATRELEAERAQAHAKAAAKDELVVRYSEPEGILLCGATRANKDRIKAVRSPQRFRYSRRLPDDCAWYVQRTRNKAFSREQIDAVADSLTRAGVERVRVDYTAPSGTAPEPAKPAAKAAPDDRLARMTKDELKDEQRRLALAGPDARSASARDALSKQYVAVVEELMRRTGSQRKAAQTTISEAELKKLADLPKHSPGKARDAAFAKAMAAGGVKAVRRLRALMRKGTRSKWDKEAASRSAAKIEALAALEAGDWPPPPERAGTYGNDAYAGILAALEVEPAIARALAMGSTFRRKLADVLKQTGAIKELGDPTTGAAFWQTHTLPDSIAAELRYPDQPPWIKGSDATALRETRKYLIEKAQRAMGEMELLLDPGLYRVGKSDPTKVSEQLCKVSSDLAQGVLHRLYRVPFKWARPGQQQASKLCDGKESIAGIKAAHEEEEIGRAERDLATAQRDRAMAPRILDVFKAASKNGSRELTQRRLNDAARRAGFKVGKDVYHSPGFVIESYRPRLWMQHDGHNYVFAIPTIDAGSWKGKSENDAWLALRAVVEKVAGNHVGSREAELARHRDALNAIRTGRETRDAALETVARYLRDDADRETLKRRWAKLTPPQKDQAATWAGEVPTRDASDWFVFRRLVTGLANREGVAFAKPSRESSRAIASMRKRQPRIELDMGTDRQARVRARLIDADGGVQIAQLEPRDKQSKIDYARGVSEARGLAPVFGLLGQLFHDPQAKPKDRKVTGYWVVCEGPLESPAESKCAKPRSLASARKIATQHAEAWGRRARIHERHRNVLGKQVEIVEPPVPVDLPEAKRAKLEAELRRSAADLRRKRDDASPTTREDRQRQLTVREAWLARVAAAAPARSSSEIAAAARRGEVVALTGPGSLAEAIAREGKAPPPPKDAPSALSPSKRKQRAAKLRELGRKAVAKGKADFAADRLENTRRRAAMAEQARRNAAREILVGEVLERAADAVEDGKLVYMAKISTRKDLETLEERLTDARYQQGRKLNLRWDEIRDLQPSAESVPFARMPEANPDYPESVKARKRLVKMGITSERALQAALREYLECCRGGKAAPRPDPIKAREQELMRARIPGFFPTPRGVVDRMLAEARIQPGDKVLEPSAGSGAIAEAIRERHPKAKLELVEFNQSLRDLLKAKGFRPASERDFLVFARGKEGRYDAIVMNPPFERFRDAQHIARALELLAPGGRLVAIASGSFPTRADRMTADLRREIKRLGGTIEKLPSGSFKGAGTGVETVIVTAQARGAAESAGGVGWRPWTAIRSFRSSVPSAT